MAVVNTDNGATIADLPIGEGTDAAGFDAVRKRAFSSNRDGTLSVVKELSADHVEALAPVKTALAARTMTIDPTTGDIFLVTADVKSIGAPQHAGGPPTYSFKPSTLRLMILQPAGGN